MESEKPWTATPYVLGVALHELDDGTILIYYGGNDTVLNLGFSHEDILAELCQRYPQDTETGQPLYDIFT